MSFLRGEPVSGTLARMAGWLLEAAEDPQCFVVMLLLCGVVAVVLIAVSAVGGLFLGDGFPGLGLR